MPEKYWGPHNHEGYYSRQGPQLLLLPPRLEIRQGLRAGGGVTVIRC